MIDTPKIVTTNAQRTAMIHLTVPRAEIRNVMGPGLSEITAAIAAQRISASGPWLTHHLRMDPRVFDFEICVPVASEVSASGRVKAGTLRGSRVVRTIYHGPYEGLGAAWGELDAWIASQGLKPAEDLWECYVAGPESSPDPSAWRTELSRPLRDSLALVHHLPAH
jgi:effector-binding domain-containing protein